MKIVIATDSFKGTLSSEEVERILKEEISKRTNYELVCVPIADGGEGLVECFGKIKGGKIINLYVTGPNFNKTEAKYLLSGEDAYIEMAEACGLPKANPKDTKEVTTYGVGELIKDALQKGAKNIYLGLGGSASTDGGCGMAAALGTEFYDKECRKFVPVGKNLCDIKRIVFNRNITLTALCDVKNHMYGENGAAYVFAPQKGANPDDVKMLDAGLRHLADIFGEYGIQNFDVEGSGAAGAMGAGVIAFFNGKLKRGIDAVLDALSYDEIVSDADVVITGEGSLDSQSFSGKVIDGIISRSKNAKIIGVVGISLIDNPEKYGISKVFETNFEHRPFEEIKKTAQSDLRNCAVKVAEYLLTL
ncbi:MAG: glycerate kinase [Clostridia bacterium]|nr:glycerate kinase [Clostridia bacterium]